MALLAVVLSAAGGCQDPVRDSAVETLGPEAAGVPRGPLHRPGQPCLLCHDEKGGAAPLLSVAGTVYADPDSRKALNKVKVVLQGEGGRMATALTNCAGNFYLRPAEFALPRGARSWVYLSGASETIEMESPFYVEGSCATCHLDPLAPGSAGHIYLFANGGPIPAELLCP
jgi:hypothetical protein